MLTRCLAAALCACAVLAAHEAPAHRALQFDASGFTKAQFGSQKQALRGPVATTVPQAPTPKTTVTVLQAEQLPTDDTAMLELLGFATGGLVVVLPEDTKPVARAVRALEKAVVSRPWNAAVFVVPAASSDFVSALQAGATHVVSNMPMPPAAVTPKTAARIATITAEASIAAPRVIAVVAHMDTLGAFPTAAQPAAGSGAAVLLQVAEALGRATSADPKASARLIFVLSTGGRQNYAGAKKWLEAADAALVDKLELVVCLEDVLAAGEAPEELFVHTSRKLDADGTLKEAVAALQQAAGTVKVTPVTKGIDHGSSELRWEHEVFAHRGTSAMTLSAAKKPARQALRTSVADKLPSPAAVTSVAETVAAMLASLAKVTGRAVAPSRRAATFLSRPLVTFNATAEVLVDAQRALASCVDAPRGKKAQPTVRRAEFDFDMPEVTFYNGQSATLTLYPSVAIEIEAGLLAAAVLYVVAMALVVLGPADATAWVCGKKKSS